MKNWLMVVVFVVFHDIYGDVVYINPHEVGAIAINSLVDGKDTPCTQILLKSGAYVCVRESIEIVRAKIQEN